MGLIQLVAPAIEPLTIAEVMKHLVLDASNFEPVPVAPVAALGNVAGNVDNGAHRYRLTFVTADGETDGGLITDIVTVVDQTVEGQVNLTSIQLGGGRVTARKLYRTAAGGSNFFLVATIADNMTTTFTDNVADASLGASCPTTNTTSDPQLASMLTSAREVVELYCNRSLITQQWKLTLDKFPKFESLDARLAFHEAIYLPRPRLQTVESITFLDWSSTQQTLDPTIYRVDVSTEPGRILKHFAKIYPPTLPEQAVIEISYTAGYGPARSDVPRAICQAMLLIIGEMYENREASNVGVNIVNEIPAVKRLLYPFRVMEAH